MTENQKLLIFSPHAKISPWITFIPKITSFAKKGQKLYTQHQMLNTAIEAAKEGSKIASAYFNNLPKVAWKKDESPVTKADVETEKVIRGYINRHYPNHGIHGEELPDKKSKSQYTWVIDPIDGTRDYIRGIPFWATYVAVIKNNKPIIGVIYLPILGDLITAEKGKGTYLNGKKVHVSKTKKLKEAYISHGQLKRFATLGKEKQLIKLSKIIRATRSYGNFGLKMLIEGKIDAMVEAYGALHDFAATSIVVEEAGGKFTSLSGKKSLTEGTGLWTNGLLHNQVLDILNTK